MPVLKALEKQQRPRIIEDEVRARLHLISTANEKVKHDSFMSMQEAVKTEISRAELRSAHNDETQRAELKMRRAAKREANLLKALRQASTRQIKDIEKRAVRAVAAARVEVFLPLLEDEIAALIEPHDGRQRSSCGGWGAPLIQATRDTGRVQKEIEELASLANDVFIHESETFDDVRELRQSLLSRLAASANNARLAHRALLACSESLKECLKDFGADLV